MSSAGGTDQPAGALGARTAAQPALAVALVYLRAQAGGDFFADVPFAWSAGELRRDGVRADVFEVRYERGEAAYNRALDAELFDRLRAGGYGLVVVESCWQAAFIDHVHGLGALLCETAPAALHPDRRVDFAFHHYTRDRQPLRELVRRLRAGEALAGVPNLRAWSSAAGGLVDLGPVRPVPPEPAARLPFCPVFDTVQLGVAMDLRGEAPPLRKSLDTNDGCPFSKPVAANPAFADVPLDAPGVTLAGCSFCFMGGDYRALPWRETVAIHVDHIAAWQAGFAAQEPPRRLDEVVLRDQHAIRYLPHLLRACIARGLAPVGVLVPGRGDAILRYGDALREAAEVAAGSGFWFCLYLIGFESFSEPQLQRFNKGVTPAEYATALAELRALHRDYPAAFRLYAYGSSSFILWDPWTTLTDLSATLAFIEQHAVARLSRGLASTRLRLYPNLPLYWRAQRDGLLLAGPPSADRGAAQTGYAAEARWLTADGRVAVVEELVRRLLRHTRPEAQVGVLKAAVAWATARWPAPLPAMDAASLAEDTLATIAEVEAGWLDLRRRWRPGKDVVSEGGGERRPDEPVDWRAQAERWRAQRRARAARVERRAGQVLRLGASCNNRCPTCLGRHDQLEADPERLGRWLDEAGKSGEKLTFTGREPTSQRGLLGLVRRARAAGAPAVELVSNGRALAAPTAAARLRRAGVTELLLKRHRLGDAEEDAYVLGGGAGAAAQQAAAIAALPAAGLRWRALLIPVRGAPEELADLVRWAAARGARGVQIEVRLDEVDLSATACWRAALDAAAEAAHLAGLPLAMDGD